MPWQGDPAICRPASVKSGGEAMSLQKDATQEVHRFDGYLLLECSVSVPTQEKSYCLLHEMFL